MVTVVPLAAKLSVLLVTTGVTVAFNCFAPSAVPYVMAAGFDQMTLVAPGLTVKVWTTGVAAVYCALPVWLACTVTEPVLVIVSVLPLTFAGPEVTL